MIPNVMFTLNKDKISKFQIGNLYHKKELHNETLGVDKMKQRMHNMN